MRFLFDNPILIFFSKLMDLLLLNILAIVCCIPVITVGASVTAAHYTALKIRKNEGYVIQNFFKSFRENFKQSTVLWLILAAHVAVAGAAWMLAGNMDGIMSMFVSGTIAVLLIITILGSVWIFPLQAKFINSISMTVKNALILAFKHLFRTLLMVVIYLLPIVLMWVISLKWYIALVLFWGVSVPIYGCAVLYAKIFEQLWKEMSN